MSPSFTCEIIIIFESVKLFWFEAKNMTGLNNFKYWITINFKVELALRDNPTAK